jgi:hypothetical protein
MNLKSFNAVRKLYLSDISDNLWLRGAGTRLE